MTPTPLGSCARMCPPAEVRERRRTNEISRFERAPPPASDDESCWAVKKYRRAAAGQGDSDASQLRPPRVLLKTLQHLFARVVPWRGCGFDWRGAALTEDGDDDDASGVARALGSLTISTPDRQQADFLALYHFVSDRVRSVRKDLTIQRVEDASAVAVLEKSARFYILAGFRARQLLSSAPQRKGDWSETLNDQQLASALVQLHEIYRKQAKAAGGAGVSSAGEFVAYDILLHIDDPRAVSFMLVKVPPSTRRSAEVKRALALFVALQTQDFYGFLRRFQRASALEKSLLLKHLPAMWRTGVQAMNKAFGKLDKFTLAEFAEWLQLSGSGAARELCRAMNLHVEKEQEAPAPSSSSTLVAAPPESWEEEAAGALPPPPPPVESAFIRFKVTPLHADMDADSKQRLVVAAAQSIHAAEIAGRLTAPVLILSEGSA